MGKLKIGIPKGSMEQATITLFKQAGYTITTSSRSYYPSVDDPEIEAMLLRPQDMALYVERGVIDMGLAGRDWVIESQADVVEVQELVYSRATNRAARWVLAVAENSDIQSVKDLEGKIVFTELVETTKAYLAKHGVNARVKFSHGATEVKIPHLCEAIVEITETGSSLVANKLRIVDTVMTSATTMIASKAAMADEWKAAKITNLQMLLAGALAAQAKVGLKLNVQADNLEAVLAVLPAMRNPTVSNLNTSGWHAVETVIDEHVCRDLIPDLRQRGAEDIIEYPLNKVIH